MPVPLPLEVNELLCLSSAADAAAAAALAAATAIYLLAIPSFCPTTQNPLTTKSPSLPPRLAPVPLLHTNMGRVHEASGVRAPKQLILLQSPLPRVAFGFEFDQISARHLVDLLGARPVLGLDPRAVL